MSIAAVPAYLGTDFSSAPPGHRFTLYLEAWNSDYSVPKDKVPIVQKVLPVPPGSAAALKALRTRQAAQAESLGAELFDSIATAPFTTGLGMEHPLENGFAFLNPYGLPYLPGSGVKGVLRAASRELADGLFGGTEGWRPEHIERLFGSESDADQLVRGALTFWDVIPTLPGDKMRVDVMTPHQSHYYQNGATPHDSGQPNPIPFLTVPPGATFRFIVTCEEKYLKDDALKGGGWKTLLHAAFAHAYEWLGFGAKTAVGYGAMAPDVTAVAAREQQRQQKAREQRLASLSDAQRAIEAFIEYMQGRHESLRAKPARANGAEHNYVRAFAKEARENPDWTPADRLAAADAIEEWLPKVVEIKLKDEAKKLQLAALRGAG